MSVRVDFGGHGMAQDPLSTVEHGRERLSLDDTSPYYWALVLANNSSGHFPPIKSTIGGCGIPQGLLNLHGAYGGARSWHGTSAHRQACTTTNNVSRPHLVNRVIDRRSWYTARIFENFRTQESGHCSIVSLRIASPVNLETMPLDRSWTTS